MDNLLFISLSDFPNIGFNEKEKRCKDYERRLGEVETQLGRTIEELNISKEKNHKFRH